MAWSPDNRTSGTLLFSQIWGLVYCGYSKSPFSKLSSSVEFSFPKIPGRNLKIASKITKAADYLSSVYHWIDYETNGSSTSRYNVGYEDAPLNPAEDSQC